MLFPLANELHNYAITLKDDFITPTTANSTNDIQTDEQNIDEPGAEINPRPAMKGKILDMGNDIFNQTRAMEDKSGINLYQRCPRHHFFPRSDQGVDSPYTNNRQAPLQFL